MVQGPTSLVSGKPVASDPLPDPPKDPAVPGVLRELTFLLVTFTLALPPSFEASFSQVSPLGELDSSSRIT